MQAMKPVSRLKTNMTTVNEKSKPQQIFKRSNEERTTSFNFGMNSDIKPSVSMGTLSMTLSSESSSSLSTLGLNNASQTVVPKTSKRTDIQPSRELYLAQIRILSRFTLISTIMFLVSALGLYACILLVTTLVSATLLCYCLYSFGKHLYDKGELSLYEYLPETIQKYLTTNIHDLFTEVPPPQPTKESSSDFSFLLLYFIPGLLQDQIASIINKLPQHRKDIVLAPGGLARMFLPEQVLNVLVPEPLNNRNKVSEWGDNSSHYFSQDSIHLRQSASSDSLYSKRSSSRSHNGYISSKSECDDLRWEDDQCYGLDISSHSFETTSNPHAYSRDNNVNLNQTDDDDVMKEAISLAIQNYTSSTTSRIQHNVSQMMDSIAPTFVYSGLSISAISAVGLLGSLSQGFYRMNSTTRSENKSILSNRNIYTTSGLVFSLVSGLCTVGTTYLIRKLVRDSLSTIRMKYVRDDESKND
jgi:hypothetical protein